MKDNAGFGCAIMFLGLGYFVSWWWAVGGIAFILISDWVTQHD